MWKPNWFTKIKTDCMPLTKSCCTGLKKEFSYIILALIFPLAPWAQTPLFRAKPARELGAAQMTLMCQDRLGWMWFGGKGGLYRFDGLDFQAVRLPDSLSKDQVTALFETNDTLWAGFNSGAIGFIPIKSVFLPNTLPAPGAPRKPAATLQYWTPEEGHPAAPVTAFCTDRDGGFWIATYGEGLYCRKNGRIYQFDTDDGLSGMDIYALTCDAQGRIWAATDAGISICRMPAPGQKSVSLLTTADGLPDEIIYALHTDRQGNIWIGAYDSGVCRYVPSQKRFDYFSPDWTYGPVTSLTSYGSRELWVGTQGAGLLRLDISNGEWYTLPENHTLRREKISALYKDREGLLWVVSGKGAIYAANVRAGQLDTPYPDVQAVCADRRGRLWVGTPRGLFLRENDRFKTILPEKENVLSLWEAPDGRLLAGAFGDGVYILDSAGRVLHHLTERNGLGNGSVLSIHGDAQRAWLATLGGVTEIDLKTLQTRVYRTELGAGYIYKVLTDSKGRTWFGADGEGLIVLENGAFRHYRQAAGVSLKTVYSIVEDLQGHIWFSTEKEGLFRFDGRQFKRYTTDDHLHGMGITGLSRDGNGLIVLTYEDGIDVLHPETGHVSFYDAAGGAPIPEANFNAACHDASGNVWIGTKQGAIRLATYDEPFVYDPEPNITAVSIFLQPFDFLSNTIFDYDQNYFLFHFTGLWYTNPELVRYRYRLEGFDHDWIVSKEHFASYPNLPPGQYVFRLQASEHGEFEGTPVTTYSFRIRPPFWTRWWFILLCALTGAALIYSYVHTREKRFHREAALRRESIVSQFAALKSQINPHFLFNSFNTLITIIEENPKIAVEYVEHLSDFYRSIMVYREKELIALGEEMEVVRNFDFLLKKRYEDNFHLDDRLNGHTGGRVMPLTLQMLVENAVKHNIISAAKPLTIDIYTENDSYVVVRNNNQRKLKPEPGTHFGLQSLINRYALFGAPPVIVEETPDYFTVKVPIL